MTLLDDLRGIVGEAHVLSDADTTMAFRVDQTGRFGAAPLAVARPADRPQVAAVVAACASAGTAVVAQGGNTGLVGAGVPRGGGVVVSLTRLDALGPVDRDTWQLDAAAGVTLARVQAAATEAGVRFPVDFGARDRATIGGMVATNAGGVHAARFGMMRRQVVGLEWVRADGAVIRRMRGLVKDNTGYDLTGLLCGSEGTLGIVTAARLQLVAAPDALVTALVELDSLDAALGAAMICRRLRALEAIELMAGECLESDAPAALLVECGGGDDVTAELADALDGCTGVRSTSVATDGPRRAALWRIRDEIPERILRAGVPIKVDVAVPLGELGPFLRSVAPAIEGVAPGARVWRFGHAGDGNVHVNVTGCEPHGPTADAIEEAVLRLAVDHGGTISAEHGVGVAKARWLGLSRSPDELTTLAAVKAALDPAGILNPGVLGLNLR